MSKLLVIVGSTRPGRAADLVLPWVTEQVRAHGGRRLQRRHRGGDPRDRAPEPGIRMQVMLDDLAWWSAALEQARAARAAAQA
jgi:hypothetical protein